MSAILEQLKTLPVSERIQLVEDLWDSIANDNAAFPSLTAEQLQEVQSRRAEMEADPSIGIPWEVAKRQLLGNNK